MGRVIVPQAGCREVRAMADIEYSTLRDGDPDDLPKTLRRERDAQARKAREQAWQEQEVREGQAPDVGPLSATYSGSAIPSLQETPAIVITDFKVSIWRLALFFIKCVFAAIPALILLAALLYAAGEILQTLFPWLVKMQILIHFPTA